MARGPSLLARAGAVAWRTLMGRPLRSSEASGQKITPIEGISALSLDALTSVAYGPQAILVVLAAAGAGALHLSFPITIAIVVLLAILVISYREVIDAYPQGGGAYAVSRDNFGPRTSQLAAAALIVDYTLTVAVSIAAGVASLTSAFHQLTPGTVPLCLGILALITALNLRGLGEAARAFLLPSAVFIVGLLAIITVGLIHPLGLHQPQPGHAEVAVANLEPIGVLLILKAFSAGCSALTGVEAIANGVPLFKEPRQKQAKATENLLGGLLSVMLLGIGVLVVRFHVAPNSQQTVLSVVMSKAVGRGWAYYIVSLAITIALALAANTSFGSLPVLTSLLARDDYLPHLFSLRDDRLTFGNGIIFLTVFSGALLVAVGGNTNTLIPLFAIGVFIGFTLSQSGLVVHWRRTRPPGWKRRAAVNGTGAVVTAVATVVFLLTKFTEGAWVVVITIPLLILLFRRIEAYYRFAAKELGIGTVPRPPVRKAKTLVVVPVNGVSRLTARAVSEAESIGDEVIAVTVSFDGDGPSGRDVAAEWAQWNCGVHLEVLHTEYASIVGPIVGFIDEQRQRPDTQVVVLIPVVVPSK
ncbi:MAG TPA: APC family permease, partial [Acidimicrobiales bacterium]|nr:APC family permease [Acidimicrobiales bacterium]